MRGKATGAHRPFPREKNLYLFSSFFTYTSKYQNVIFFFDWMSHNQARIISGQSASKRLKNRVKQRVIHRVRSNVIYRVRRSRILVFNKFCAVYMTFLPLVSARPIEQLPQSIIIIRLDVANSFRKRLVSTNETQRDKIFPLFSRGNEDWKRRKRERRRWRTPLFLRQFDVLLLETFWPCSAFYRSYFCCLRHVLGKERLLAKNRYKI